ncbi:MAG: pyridoxal-phosphate dependent enzyme, partial [Desulfatiglandales bacterium]
MKIDQVPEAIRDHLIPHPQGEMFYRCLGCGSVHDISKLLYTCPGCAGVLLLEYRDTQTVAPSIYRDVLDYRKVINFRPLNGVFRYYEYIAPVIPLEHIVYLGEGGTPLVEANGRLRGLVGRDFYFKLDGLNPSASFKDRGMACALSYLNFLLKKGSLKNVLAICASTGDTSASAALYTSYISEGIVSAVLLPRGKVTRQQMAQPLGHGAKVLEIPGVFDHCMKVVEYLSERYDVALLNSKNSWRILGQESYSYEIAQDLNWDLENIVVVVPIGNAGNITAVLSGFLKFFKAGIIKALPKVIGVQSEHADPVFRYYSKPRDK